MRPHKDDWLKQIITNTVHEMILAHIDFARLMMAMGMLAFVSGLMGIAACDVYHKWKRRKAELMKKAVADLVLKRRGPGIYDEE